MRRWHVAVVNTGVKDLKLWQEAVALAGDVVRAVRQHGKRELSQFTDELIAKSLALASGIAEGYGRGDALDQQRLFELARRSLTALETHLAIAKSAGALPQETVAALITRAAGVGRLLVGFLTFIERQKDSEQADGVLRLSPATATSPLRKALDEIYCA